MELVKESVIHNFRVTNIRSIPDSDAELVEMVYEKTGTPLCWVKTGRAISFFL